MIFNNLTFAGTKQWGSSETTQKKFRSALSEVSSNNMLTTILRPFLDNKVRECWRRPWNHNDHKRPKLAVTDSSTFSENIPISKE